MTTTTEEPKKDPRAYDRERMKRLSLAMYAALIVEQRDELGVVCLPMNEVLEAMAILGGMLLASWPDAKVPSKLRMRGQEIGRSFVDWTGQAMANPDIAKMFTVMPESSEAQH